MKTIKICGVPEHFNLPWHLCIENGEFEEVGINLQWQDVPEGTGKMCQMLRNEETDIAIILTEGIIKDTYNDSYATIVQEYVQSPLIWGIHVNHNSKINSVSELKDKKAAISRMGSGSHLMSFVLAKKLGFDTSKLEFEIVHTIDGAAKSLEENIDLFFMWEKFMTQPFIDKNIFKRIGEIPTPWPCFVVAVNSNFYKNNTNTVAQILDIINATTQEFKDIPSIDRTLSSRYQLQIVAIREWLSITHWSQKKWSEQTQNEVIKLLKEVSIL